MTRAGIAYLVIAPAVSLVEALEAALKQKASASAEEIARTICLSYGRDPDEMTSIGEMCTDDNQPVPIWMVYEEQADAILSTYAVARAILDKDDGK